VIRSQAVFHREPWRGSVGHGSSRAPSYTGTERAPDADILFASIQTLSRRRHLHRFGPRNLEGLVLNEFHHAPVPARSIAFCVSQRHADFMAAF
jgi:superfamily II DNA or RNA helicase